MSNDLPNSDKLRDTKNAHLLKDGAGTNPGGNRYIYDVEKSTGECSVRNIGFIGVSGTSSKLPNLHPQEVKGKISLTSGRLDVDFIPI